MHLTPATHKTLMTIGAAYALVGALLADLSGNYATAAFGLIGLTPFFIGPNKPD